MEDRTSRTRACLRRVARMEPRRGRADRAGPDGCSPAGVQQRARRLRRLGRHDPRHRGGEDAAAGLGRRRTSVRGTRGRGRGAGSPLAPVLPPVLRRRARRRAPAHRARARRGSPPVDVDQATGSPRRRAGDPARAAARLGDPLHRHDRRPAPRRQAQERDDGAAAAPDRPERRSHDRSCPGPPPTPWAPTGTWHRNNAAPGSLTRWDMPPTCGDSASRCTKRSPAPARSPMATAPRAGPARFPQLALDPAPLPRDVPEPLASLVAAAIARRPSDRPSAAEIVAELDPLTEAIPPQPMLGKVRVRAWKPAARP